MTNTLIVGAQLLSDLFVAVLFSPHAIHAASIGEVSRPSAIARHKCLLPVSSEEDRHHTGRQQTGNTFKIKEKWAWKYGSRGPYHIKSEYQASLAFSRISFS